MSRSRHPGPRGIIAFAVLVACLGHLSPVGGQVANNLPSIGQEQTVLEGTVVDSEGHGIPMARLSLTTRSSPIGQTAFSDEDARFFFYRLQPASYSLTVSAAGFETTSQVVDMNFGSLQVRIVMKATSDASPVPVGGTTLDLDDLKVSSSARKRYEKGQKFLSEGDPKKAVKEFQSALEEEPEFAASHSALGIAYIQLRDFESAEKAFKKAIQLRETLGEAHLGLGLVENERNAYQGAELELTRARELLPEDWRVFYEMGRSLYHQNRLEEAEVSLILGRSLKPDYGNLRILLANIFALQGNLADALAEMRAFLEVAPESPLADQVREKVSLLEAEIARAK